MDKPTTATIASPLLPSPELRKADPQFAAMCDVVREQGEIIAMYRAICAEKDKIISDLSAQLLERMAA